MKRVIVSLAFLVISVSFAFLVGTGYNLSPDSKYERLEVDYQELKEDYRWLHASYLRTLDSDIKYCESEIETIRPDLVWIKKLTLKELKRLRKNIAQRSFY